VYSTNRRRRRVSLILLFALGILAVAGVVRGLADGSESSGGAPSANRLEGSGDRIRAPADDPPPPVRRLETFTVGSGAASATIMRPAGVTGPQPTVILLHGWLLAPADYAAWSRHLAFARNTVILPQYQEGSVTAPSDVLEAVVAGLRAALERVEVAPGTLVVAGHSAGGELAADLSAVAESEGLPAPLAIFSVYPGRALRGYPGGIPAADPADIPSGTRLVVLASAADTVVGEGPAKQLAAAPTQLPASLRRLRSVSIPGAGDHYAPTRPDPAARKAFWRPLDRLISEVRGKP
jgi:acetyl esterase/lipase